MMPFSSMPPVSPFVWLLHAGRLLANWLIVPLQPQAFEKHEKQTVKTVGKNKFIYQIFVMFA
jgi:hypothetical protein